MNPESPQSGELTADGLTPAEVSIIAGAVAAAVSPADGLTTVQRAVLNAMCDYLLGVAVDLATVDLVGPGDFATAMASHDRSLIVRIVQAMFVGELLLSPLPIEVCERVESYAAHLGVDDQTITTARDLAQGSREMVLVDFERSGYLEHPSDHSAMNEAHANAASVWARRWDDRQLARRWEALESCPNRSIGLAVWRFYQARGFAFPGNPESAPPFLAQHDFVHVLADYGSTVESEIEVFGLIARANPDFGAFALLAMVLNLFETGAIAQGAGGFFERDAGHISADAERMGIRLGDAMARGKRIARSLAARRLGTEADLLSVDWFSHADQDLAAVRTRLGLPPKTDRAIAAGSIGPFQPGGISPYQARQGKRQAAQAGRIYDGWGATPVEDASGEFR
jgi:hypothetical protein